MTKPTVLIVDDEKPTRDGLRAALEERFDVYVAEDSASAIELLERESFDVLLNGSEEVAVEAMKRGADDYLPKGRMQIEELEMRIARALRQRTLETENESLHRQLDHRFGIDDCR
jgi:PleD family two-component response regulator